jgi:hypothetical protein
MKKLIYYNDAIKCNEEVWVLEPDDVTKWFSYDWIQLLETIKIPIGQQMLVYKKITIDGILEINGKLILVD